MVLGVVTHAFRRPTHPHTQAGREAPEEDPQVLRAGEREGLAEGGSVDGSRGWWLPTPGGPTQTPAGQSLCPMREARAERRVCTPRVQGLGLGLVALGVGQFISQRGSVT